MTRTTKTTRTTNNRSSFLFLLLPISAILLAILVSNFVVFLIYVPSGSMADTLPENAVVFGSRLAYRKEAPARGDIVLFRHAEAGKTVLIKRVIAVGGDTFEIRGGTVYLNGEAIDEPYVSSAGTEDFPPVTVPEGKLIVLGDNRAASRDSRFWEDPFVEEGDLVGKAVFLLFPFVSKL